MPAKSVVPGHVDRSLDAVSTREKKTGNQLPNWNAIRMMTEATAVVPAVLPVNPGQNFGQSTRLQGRDPALFVR